MICPVYTNLTVRDLFNEIVTALGGQALTDEEFRDSTLRNQRTGSEFAAMEAAYRIWHRNNGNPIDCTPDVKQETKSILFLDLLDYYDGDRMSAIRAKSQIYSNKFILKFGNWFDGEEPNISQLSILKKNNEKYNYSAEYYDNPFEIVDYNKIFDSDIVNRLNEGKSVSSKEIIESCMTKPNFFTGRIAELAKVLALHDIPVMLAPSTQNTVFATTLTDNNGRSVILINREFLSKVSKQFAGEAMLHELIHAITAESLQFPKTEQHRIFKRATEKVFNSIKNGLSKSELSAFNASGSFALANTHEFVSEFMTNEVIRESIYASARHIDNKRNLGVVDILKRFANKLFKLFVNKQLFNTQSNVQELLKQYERYLRNYINNSPTIENSSIPSNSVLRKIYDSIDNSVLENDLLDGAYQTLNKFNDAVVSNNIRLDWEITREKRSNNIPVEDRYDSIKNSLLSRINALKSSTLNTAVKKTLIDETQSQLNLFNNPAMTKYEIISGFMKMLSPRLIEALDELRKTNEDYSKSTDPTNYMFQMHDNIGMFESVVKDLSIIIENDQECEDIVELFNKLASENKLQIEDIKAFKNNLINMNGIIRLAQTILYLMRKNAAINTLYNTVEEAGSLEGKELLDKIYADGSVIEQDINWLSMQFGQADASSSEIIRAVAHIIQKANDKVEDKTYSKAVKLLKLLKNLKRGESVKDLYEFADGQPTQYLVRDLNFGKMLKDRREFLKKLNEDYGLPENNTVPPENEKDRISWNLRYNKWLKDHVHRKYTPLYYEAWASVPTHIKDSIDKFNSGIYTILIKYDAIDSNGIPHYEKITDKEDWLDFNKLIYEKKLMRLSYDRFGNKKEGTALEDAEILLKLYKKLYNEEYTPRSKKVDEWKAKRLEIIDDCGGQEQYELFLKGESNYFNFDKLDEWDARNSKYVFKKDERGMTVLDRIEEKLHGMKLDYGERYKELKEIERQLLNPAYDMAGEINETLLSESTKHKLVNEIYPEMNKIKNEVIKNVPGYAQLKEKYDKLLDQYVVFVDTRYFKDLLKQIYEESAEITGTFDMELYSLILSGYGTLFGDDPISSGFRPHKWLLTMRASNQEDMELVPNDAWQDYDAEKPYSNEYWTKNNLDKYGEALVPNIEEHPEYNNEKAFAKVMDDNGGLKALYKEVKETLKESNELQTNRSWTNDYQLPGVSAQLLERLSRRGWAIPGIWYKIKQFFKWVGEKFGIKYWSELDVKLQGDTTINDDTNEDRDEFRSNFTRVIGTHADGRQYSSLPQYFTRRLDNPENISFKLIDMVLSYYKMSVNYSEKNKIRDACETMLDYVKDQSYSKDEIDKSKNKIVAYLKGANYAEESNVYKSLKSLLDIGLYGTQVAKIESRWFSLSMFLSTVRLLTSATNLGMNKKVAVVGFLTAMHAHYLNSFVGKEYKFKDLVNAQIEVAKNISFKTLREGPYNNLSNNKLQVIMESFNLAGQLDKKITDTDMNQFTRAIYQNYTYGYLATVDYLTKSLIALATLKNYKYIDGKIYSSLDIDYLRHDSEEYKLLLSKYANAKSIYDLMKVKDGMLYFDDKNIQKAWDKHKDVIKNKCVKQAEKADGVATTLQKAAVQQSWIGLFLMIHRQFLPLMLNERFGKRVYDYDTQEYKNGQFRTMFKYISELMLNSWGSGVIGSSLAISAFFGPVAGIIAGTAIGSAVRIGGKVTGRNKSIKLINKEFFGDFSNQKSTISSTENKYAIKLIIIENIMRLLMSYLVVQPLCDYADDDKDDYFLQCLAYWLKASQWEIGAPYNVEDMFTNIKSPTAATSILDKVTNANQSVFSGAYLDAIYNLSLSEDQSPTIGKNSPYVGWKRWHKALFQLAGPIHNEFEQNSSIGVKGKRKYLERQMFHEKAGDNFNIYKYFYENK